MNWITRSLAVSVCLVFCAGEALAQSEASSAPGSSAAFSEPLGQRRSSFGTKDQIQYHLRASEFFPEYSFDGYSVAFDPIGFRTKGRYSVGLLSAVPHLPSGALLHSIELDYCDSGAQDVSLQLVECDFMNDDCLDPLVQLTTFDALEGCNSIIQDISGLGYTVDNNNRQLTLYAQSPAADAYLVGAYIGYKLQVSPAPGAATFGDVPTSHPYFRFIEALAASGVTAGCGAGNYCPGAAITRGEMAVFLAKALGLHFPN